MSGCLNHGEATDKSCYLCWLFRNDHRYNVLWEGSGIVESERWPMPKVHRSESSSRTESTVTPLSVSQQLLNFGKALINHAADGFAQVNEDELNRRKSICAACPEYENGKCKKCGCFTNLKASWQSEKCPINKWGKRHLLYYIWPLKANHLVWKWNVNQLLQRIGLFNGRKIIVVATEGSESKLETNTLEEIQKEFGNEAKDITWLEISAKQHELGEMAGWNYLWEELQKTSNLSLLEDVVFYAHAKGMSYGWNDKDTNGRIWVIRTWTRLMYENCLDYWRETQEKLSKGYLAISAFKNHIAQNKYQWHFAGSFFWVNAGIGINNYKLAPKNYYGSENWVGEAIPKEVSTIICDDLCNWTNLNDSSQMKELEKRWETWKISRNSSEISVETIEIPSDKKKDFDLHIVTPIWNKKNFYDSILKSLKSEHFNLLWYVPKTRETWNNTHPNYIPELNKFHRNTSIEKIKDGWIHFLDWDTILHPDLDSVLYKCINDYLDIDVFVFSQQDHNKRLRLQTNENNVGLRNIDMGQFICKREAINNIRFDAYGPPEAPGAVDYVFFEQLRKSGVKIKYINTPASYYNYLRF